MGCDYIIETAFVIEFYSVKGEIDKIVTNIRREKCCLNKYHDNFYKYIKKLKEKINKKCFIKTIYENDVWTKENYQSKYESKIRRWFPKIDKFIKIYKDSISWPVKKIAYLI